MELVDLRILLKSKRERQGLSQFEIADQVGVTQAFIARIESGAAQDVSYSKIQRILNALDQNPKQSNTQRSKRHAEIKEALLDAGFTLRDLARELGVHDSTVGSVVAGRGSSKRIEERIKQITGLHPYHSSNKGASDGTK